jgi:hypothetical protein
MSGFEVTPGNLLLGSSLIRTSGVGQGTANVGSAGAAAQTPLAGAWSDFVDRADKALSVQYEVVDDLARALSIAATAYQVTDEAAAHSLHVNQ